MRVDPVFKSKRNTERKAKVKATTRKITRVVAITLAVLVTYGLFIKILFF